MIVLALVLFIKINQTGLPEEEVIYIDLKTLEEIKKLEQLTPERISRAADRQARNIAVDQDEDRVERYDDYQDYRLTDRSADREARNRVNQDIKDIIKENNLDPDDRELPRTEPGKVDFYKAEKIEEEQVYKGPTNIYYKLDDRKVVYLHIPVYKCQGGATVKVDIRVGQRGKVELVTINNQGTDTRDPCFLQAAKEAAQRTRFNFNSSAPMLQQGHIIYHFVAQ